MSETAALTGVAEASGYDSGGTKPVLVLLHGIGGTWHVWTPVLKLLEGRHRVVAITLPGHTGGPAYSGSGAATIGGLADQIIALLRGRGIERADVAGNSLGGWLAIELARRGFARSIVALSPAGGWRRHEDFVALARSFSIVFTLLPLIIFLTSWLMRFAWIRRALGRKTMEHAERMSAEEFRASMCAMRDTQIFRELLGTLGRDGPIAPLSLSIPARVAWGGCDRVIPFERYGHGVLRSLSNADAHVVSGVGHVPMYDDPLQVAAQILEVSARAAAAPSSERAA